MSGPTIYHLFFALALLICTTLFLRFLLILPSINPHPPTKNISPSQTHLMIILGSGGHTAEMLSMLRSLPLHRYQYRTYIVSSGDDFSALKAIDFERERARSYTNDHNDKDRKGQGKKEEGEEEIGNYCIRTVPRARKIHQPLWSTVFTSIRTLLVSLRILTTYPPPPTNYSTTTKTTTTTKNPWSQLAIPQPSLILTNGPGTSVILLLASLLLKFIDYNAVWTTGGMRTIYVESWARCKTLSLTGKILGKVGMVERFLVQWEGVSEGRAEFRGVLVE